MKYLRVTVFLNSLGDCTNGGVSSTTKELYVEHSEGCELKKPPDPSMVFRIEHRGGDYYALIPKAPSEGMVGPMFGGNLASSLSGTLGDRIFRIHDRFETPADYARND